jgi:hypothetical protein
MCRALLSGATVIGGSVWSRQQSKNVDIFDSIWTLCDHEPSKLSEAVSKSDFTARIQADFPVGKPFFYSVTRDTLR